MKVHRPVNLERDVLTLEEAGLYLQISRQSIVKLATKGELPGRKLGTQWRFLKSELEKFLHGSSPAKTG